MTTHRELTAWDHVLTLESLNQQVEDLRFSMQRIDLIVRSDKTGGLNDFNRQRLLNITSKYVEGRKRIKW